MTQALTIRNGLWSLPQLIIHIVHKGLGNQCVNDYILGIFCNKMRIKTQESIISPIAFQFCFNTKQFGHSLNEIKQRGYPIAQWGPSWNSKVGKITKW